MAATRNLDWIVGLKVTQVSIEDDRITMQFDNGVMLFLGGTVFVERPQVFITAQQCKDGKDWEPK